MTAVEYLIEQMIYQMGIRIENTTVGCELFEKSKEMEKRQIIDAYKEGCFDNKLDESTDSSRAKQYYEITYNKPKQ